MYARRWVGFPVGAGRSPLHIHADVVALCGLVDAERCMNEREKMCDRFTHVELSNIPWARIRNLCILFLAYY